MPLPKGVKYRVKKTKKGNVRLAFKAGKVVEAKNMKTGALHNVLADHIRKKKFGGKTRKFAGKEK